MDPITHAVIGASIAKVTGNEIALTDAATMGMVIGAMFPDIDILMQKWGDRVYLKNHRGVTHSIVGLAVSSFAIAGILSMFYSNAGMLGLFLWTFLGCLSHSFFDMFNPYGARILWPFVNKKYTFGLLTVVDPIYVGSLVGYILTNGRTQYIFLGVFALYMAFRLFMRVSIVAGLKKHFGAFYERISVYPSLSGLFKWHFVLEGKDINIIGEKLFLKRSVKVKKRLYKKLEDEELDKVLYSPVGEYFSDFTPLVHVNSENVDGVIRYTFIDMRYYVRDNFLHHAILEMDETDSIINASFNPYSIHRSNSIPI